MNILVIGNFPGSVRSKIRDCFQYQCEINITDENSARGFLEEAEVLIPEHFLVDSAVLGRSPRLRLVQTGAGYDNVDIAACSERGVAVCSAAGVNANAVAEHTLALMLGWYKNIVYLDSFMKSGRELERLEYSGSEIRGMTAGIIGLGAAGQRTASLCRAFGMNVLGYTRTPEPVDGVRTVSLGTLLKESDMVSLHVPLTMETFHLLGMREFQLMKSSALLINTSRGAVINEEELAEALQNNVISGACLDVFESEPLPSGSRLRGLPNVILTPHTAGLPDGVRFHKARYEFFARNIQCFFSGKEPANLLNRPL